MHAQIHIREGSTDAGANQPVINKTSHHVAVMARADTCEPLRGNWHHAASPRFTNSSQGAQPALTLWGPLPLRRTWVVLLP
jgi:hypothetical protein